jgi:hypothetical protein
MRFYAAEVPAAGDVRLVADDGAEWRGTLPGMVAELGRVAKTMRREHLRVWVRGMDDAARRCVAEGVELGAGDLRLDEAGVGSISLGARVRLVSPGPLVPGQVLDEMVDDAAELLRVCDRVQRSICDALPVDPATSLGRMAGEGVAALGRRWTYPEPQGGPITEAARECLHGGLCEVWHEGESVVVDGAQDFPRDWFGEPGEILPAGWTLRDEDRSSAYAAEAARPLPSVWGPAYCDAGAAGGALVLASVDLEAWSGVALPVRMRAGRTVRQIAATRGKWRGWWSSPVLDYAATRGAKVEIETAIGWKHADDYLAPGMDRLFQAKQRHARGTVERAALTAAMQRAVGRLARRDGVDSLVDADDFGRLTSDELQAAGIVRDLGRFGRWALVRKEPGPETPRGTCPVWPAFVVGRAWVSICERIEAIKAIGGRPLYADTDGILWAKAPGAALELGDGAGAWQLRNLPDWAWCERAKLYLRGTGHTIAASASAGIPRADLLWYLEGGGAPYRRESLREQAARRATEPQEVRSWSERKIRTKPTQPAPKLKPSPRASKRQSTR